MSRIITIENETASPEQRELFDAINQQMGMVPNFLKVLANSPDALRAFLGLHHIAGEGSLDAQTRESIALAIAQKTACQYCISAHTAIGRKAGLSREEIQANRTGSSQDEKTAVAVRFTQTLIEHKGEVTNDEVQSLREVGYSDSDIVEIITHTGMNFLTNLIGKASRVEIDFPTIDMDIAA